MNTVFIYALNDPETGKTRYIGKSKNPQKRFWDHLSDQEQNHRTNWIKSLCAHGLKPVLQIWDEVPEEYWQRWERGYIQSFREAGFDLVNGTDGGDSGPSLKGIKLSPERCAKSPEHIAAARLGRILSQERKAKVGYL